MQQPSSTSAFLRRHAFLAFVVLVTLEMQREVWVELDASAATQTRVALLSLGTTAALLLCRRMPLLAVVLGFGAPLGIELVNGVWESMPTAAFATLPIGYALGRRTNGRRLWWGVGLAAALSIATMTAEFAAGHESATAGAAFSRLLLSLAPIWLGTWMRDRAALHAALEAEAERAEADREAALDRFVLDERTRIAGELHDLIAHALSAIVVQASVARTRALTDEAAAEQSLVAVEETGREALVEIRSLLGVLR